MTDSRDALLRTLLAACATVLALAGTPSTAAAQPAAETADVDATAGDASALAEGEIRKIDKEAGKLTIRHGPLRNLDMPGMTMVFGVKDEAVLDELAPGDKVSFRAERIDGRITVTRIEARPPAPQTQVDRLVN